MKRKSSQLVAAAHRPVKVGAPDFLQESYLLFLPELMSTKDRHGPGWRSRVLRAIFIQITTQKKYMAKHFYTRACAATRSTHFSRRRGRVKQAAFVAGRWTQKTERDTFETFV